MRKLTSKESFSVKPVDDLSVFLFFEDYYNNYIIIIILTLLYYYYYDYLIAFPLFIYAFPKLTRGLHSVEKICCTRTKRDITYTPNLFLKVFCLQSSKKICKFDALPSERFLSFFSLGCVKLCLNLFLTL